MFLSEQTSPLDSLIPIQMQLFIAPSLCLPDDLYSLRLIPNCHPKSLSSLSRCSSSETAEDSYTVLLRTHREFCFGFPPFWCSFRVENITQAESLSIWDIIDFSKLCFSCVVASSIKSSDSKVLGQKVGWVWESFEVWVQSLRTTLREVINFWSMAAMAGSSCFTFSMWKWL